MKPGLTQKKTIRSLRGRGGQGSEPTVKTEAVLLGRKEEKSGSSVGCCSRN